MQLGLFEVAFPLPLPDTGPPAKSKLMLTWLFPAIRETPQAPWQVNCPIATFGWLGMTGAEVGVAVAGAVVGVAVVEAADGELGDGSSEEPEHATYANTRADTPAIQIPRHVWVLSSNFHAPPFLADEDRLSSAVCIVSRF